MTNPYEFIKKKKEGFPNKPGDIKGFVRGYLDGSVADYQMSAWLMAVNFNGLTVDELLAYTEALIESGKRFNLSEIPGFKVDKHSTGGVGDKVSIVLAPLVASCGAVVPMVSGRGLGHTGGTLDKLASIPGFRTDLAEDEFKRFLGKIGVAMMGQTSELCPADGRIYALRDVTATVESIPLIAASISAKKIAEGAEGLVLDVKVGNGAFVKTAGDARTLVRTIIDITSKFDVRTTALLTDMNQPLGRAVGNSLEVIEAVECLKGEGPEDLRELVLELSALMLVLAGRKDIQEGRIEARKAFDSGNALEKFRKLVEIQGGNPRIIDDCTLLPKAGYEIPVRAEINGHLNEIDTYKVGMLALELGAGRVRKEDEIDPAVGFTVFKKIGDEVAKDEPLALVHSSSVSKGKDIAFHLAKCFSVKATRREIKGLILERIQ